MPRIFEIRKSCNCLFSLAVQGPEHSTLCGGICSTVARTTQGCHLLMLRGAELMASGKVALSPVGVQRLKPKRQVVFLVMDGSPFHLYLFKLFSASQGGNLVSRKFPRLPTYYLNSYCGANLTHQHQNPLVCLLQCTFLDPLRRSRRPMSRRLVRELPR